jgi:hypothetical protein
MPPVEKSSSEEEFAHETLALMGKDLVAVRSGPNMEPDGLSCPENMGD